MRGAVNDNRFSMPVHTLRRQLEAQGFEVVDISIWAAMHSDAGRFIQNNQTFIFVHNRRF